ncbi:MAG: enoyl-CoA hydratase/isomerase family protein [Chloroflexi bacterium]|nr:enoyl-CoA hydratase/isomerase family protein [Chloroflexota bacterium]
MSMSYDKYKAIKVEKKEGVLAITLNLPDRGNPTRDVWPELDDLWPIAADDHEVNAILLAAAGPDFSVGLDFRAMLHPKETSPLEHLELVRGVVLRESIRETSRHHLRSLRNIVDVPQPIIAAVQGRCLGAAATIVLACDIRIVADDLQIGDTHIVRGLVPGDGGAAIWPLLVGLARSKEYLLTGDILSAVEAERIGLVNRVVPAAELQNAAWSFAKRLASGPPLAIRLTKHAINRVLQQQLANILDVADAFEAFSAITEDHEEAGHALVEKRKPKFTGR